ncbi:MAG: hypothetical protein Q9M97_07930 [Candidatus Gracilibacteria bacterium]|nr:hypothetical protein [Candidatus Gracilibacteria bacterium]
MIIVLLALQHHIFPTSNIIVDTIAPSIIFVDNVITGPVQSDTINITVSDINPDTASLGIWIFIRFYMG